MTPEECKVGMRVRVSGHLSGLVTDLIHRRHCLPPGVMNRRPGARGFVHVCRDETVLVKHYDGSEAFYRYVEIHEIAGNPVVEALLEDD